MHLLAGTYRSVHDTATRRVWGTPARPAARGEPAHPETLWCARTRAGRAEEEPFVLAPDYLRRLLAYGCWRRL